ncbi:MAG: EutN/CcmL family microcompartment protein [Phycisphaeraceae bacterium]
MRLAWVTGRLTLSRGVPDFKPGSWLVCEALDAAALEGDAMKPGKRVKPMPESLIVYDRMGAGVGDLIAFSEGGEATQPFRPDRVPIDAYCAAIIDSVHIPTSRKQ